MHEVFLLFSVSGHLTVYIYLGFISSNYFKYLLVGYEKNPTRLSFLPGKNILILFVEQFLLMLSKIVPF
jgi:hypothetical protein